MAFTYDPTTSAGRARLLIPDNIEDTSTFDDAEIEAFLAMNGGDPYLAAATAIETIAGSEAMVLKVMSVLGTTTDGAKLCEALLKRAAILRANAGADGSADAEYVGIAGLASDIWSARERAA